MLGLGYGSVYRLMSGDWRALWRRGIVFLPCMDVALQPAWVFDVMYIVRQGDRLDIANMRKLCLAE